MSLADQIINNFEKHSTLPPNTFAMPDLPKTPANTGSKEAPTDKTGEQTAKKATENPSEKPDPEAEQKKTELSNLIRRQVANRLDKLQSNWMISSDLARKLAEKLKQNDDRSKNLMIQHEKNRKILELLGEKTAGLEKELKFITYCEATDDIELEPVYEDLRISERIVFEKDDTGDEESEEEEDIFDVIRKKEERDVNDKMIGNEKFEDEKLRNKKLGNERLENEQLEPEKLEHDNTIENKNSGNEVTEIKISEPEADNKMDITDQMESPTETKSDDSGRKSVESNEKPADIAKSPNNNPISENMSDGNNLTKDELKIKTTTKTPRNKTRKTKKVTHPSRHFETAETFLQELIKLHKEQSSSEDEKDSTIFPPKTLPFDTMFNNMSRVGEDSNDPSSILTTMTEGVSFGSHISNIRADSLPPVSSNLPSDPEYEKRLKENARKAAAEKLGQQVGNNQNAQFLLNQHNLTRGVNSAVSQSAQYANNQQKSVNQQLSDFQRQQMAHMPQAQKQTGMNSQQRAAQMQAYQAYQATQNQKTQLQIQQEQYRKRQLALSEQAQQNAASMTAAKRMASPAYYQAHQNQVAKNARMLNNNVAGQAWQQHQAANISAYNHSRAAQMQAAAVQQQQQLQHQAVQQRQHQAAAQQRQQQELYQRQILQRQQHTALAKQHTALAQQQSQAAQLQNHQNHQNQQNHQNLQNHQNRINYQNPSHASTHTQPINKLPNNNPHQHNLANQITLQNRQSTQEAFYNCIETFTVKYDTSLKQSDGQQQKQRFRLTWRIRDRELEAIRKHQEKYKYFIIHNSKDKDRLELPLKVAFEKKYSNESKCFSVSLSGAQISQNDFTSTFKIQLYDDSRRTPIATKEATCKIEK